jgi:hypothetical protein
MTADNVGTYYIPGDASAFAPGDVVRFQPVDRTTSPYGTVADYDPEHGWRIIPHSDPINGNRRDRRARFKRSQKAKGVGEMKRRPFDEVCACDHETANDWCVCTRPKEQAKAACSNCMAGSHKMKPIPGRLQK